MMMIRSAPLCDYLTSVAVITWTMCCIILGSCRCPTKLTSESFDFITLNTHVKLTV